jgi:hypothetical protein
LSVFSLARAGRWFLESGIQESSGGFSRYYRSEIQKNLPVSTEISAYAAKALLFLHRRTGERAYLDAARNTVSFLVNQAYDRSLHLFPYEHPCPTAESRWLAYFFDSGIIVRGLVAFWHETHDDRILDVATAAAHGMSAFWTGRDYHAILTLPDKRPLMRTAQWSTAPGCYQAKSALAWWELAAVTGDETLKRNYLDTIESGMHTCRGFLAGSNQRLKIVDRLHAYSYFLEALSPLLDRADCVKTYRFALEEASHWMRELAPEFCRSDVYAQILRARIRASHVISVDRAAAAAEASALESFQAESADPRLDGGFVFGRCGATHSPHVNPVSTAFAIQALDMWRAFQAGDAEACLQPPI